MSSLQKPKMPNKKGANILTGNIIFIVFYLTFLTILLVFLVSKNGIGATLEEKYAKQIALAIDASQPVMQISLDMSDAIKSAQKNNYPIDKIVSINGNVITVKLETDSRGYSYSFFNDVDVNANFDTTTKTSYYFVINKK